VARLEDLPPAQREGALNLPLPSFESTPWTPAPPLREARVALISTAGLGRRDEGRFRNGATDYHLIPGDIDPNDLIMSHVSVNFDRSGFQQDVNVVFPLNHLRSLAAAGEIGGVSRFHYSFMGATDPARVADSGAQVGKLLHDDGVDVALLAPV
jgi:D-proline reductase (dithiol) PrdB